MENKTYINSLGYNFLEPILVEKQDNKIIISEEDLKKAINQAYEAGKRSTYNYNITPSPSTPINPIHPCHPDYFYYLNYPNWICGSNNSGKRNLDQLF